MQHVFGKPLYRSTEWRRQKRFEQEGGISRKGRRWASDFQDRGFLGFAASVVSLINKNGSVGYGELFLPVKSPGEGGSYWKDETTDRIFGKLAKSGFPPAMLAVAACMIGKLNKQTRRGAMPTNLLPHEQALRKVKESGKEITTRIFDTALRKEKLEIVLKQNHFKKADREQLVVEAEKNDFTDNWVLDYLRQYKSPSTLRAHGLLPVSASSRSTPPHQIDFLNGARLTRQMASYWRTHRRFSECLKFVNGLLKRDRPKAPSERFFALPPDPWMHGEFSTYMKVRRIELQNRKQTAKKQG